MSQTGTFRTRVIGGFDRNDVLEYIQQVSKRAMEIQTSLTAEIAQLTETRDSFARQVEAYREKLSALERAVEAERANTLAVREKLDAARTRLNTVEQGLVATKEENRQLTFQAETYKQKAIKFDQLSLEYGSVIVEAKDAAQKIISTARERADALAGNSMTALSNAKKEVALFKEDLQEMHQQIVDILTIAEAHFNKLIAATDRIDEDLNGRFSGPGYSEEADGGESAAAESVTPPRAATEPVMDSSAATEPAAAKQLFTPVVTGSRKTHTEGTASSPITKPGYRPQEQRTISRQEHDIFSAIRRWLS